LLKNAIGDLETTVKRRENASAPHAGLEAMYERMGFAKP
jgi:hypothetical protein